MKILFLHGWQSVPGGVKPSYLAQHGHEVINPKLPDEDFEEALRIAQAEYDRHRPDVVVCTGRRTPGAGRCPWPRLVQVLRARADWWQACRRSTSVNGVSRRIVSLRDP
jgi:hypothetical protein